MTRDRAASGTLILQIDTLSVQLATRPFARSLPEAPAPVDLLRKNAAEQGSDTIRDSWTSRISLVHCKTPE